MRVTPGMMMSSMLHNIEHNQARTEQLQNQITSGSRITKPSDDPIGAARALNLGDELGSLLPGKSADVICVDLSGIEHQPLLDPLSELVYSASRHDVTDVWVAGEHLIVQREAVRLDLPAITAAAGRWARRLQGMPV